VVVCLERGADCLHMVQLMPPPGAPMLLAGNDTVPISLWRGGGVRCAECSLVVVLLCVIFSVSSGVASTNH